MKRIYTKTEQILLILFLLQVPLLADNGGKGEAAYQFAFSSMQRLKEQFRKELAVKGYGLFAYMMLPPAENCSNGIDDDGDGLIDAGDPDCGGNIMQTIPAGSYIINMGVQPQTVGNALKPYGLIWYLLHEYQVPVKWAINPAKSKDGVDFTYNGVAYRGGPFIISSEFRTPQVNSLIQAWEAKGVVGITTASDFSAPVNRTLNYSMNWTLNKTNGGIAQAYLDRAEIPETAYGWTLPNELDCCHDVYLMPHSEPTWLTHSQIYFWNASPANGGCSGTLWAGCKAGSEVENIKNPASPYQRMNFLMLDPNAPQTNPAVPDGSHQDGTIPPPYSYDFPAHPVMQFLGLLDGAQEGGAEQIYLPTNGWRPSTFVGVWDATHPNVPSLSPGPAAKLAFGPAFGDPTRGAIMYEAAHRLDRDNSQASIAAQRAFFNFSFYAAGLKAIHSALNVTATMQAGQTYNLSASANGGSGNYVFEWTSSCGGTFSNPFSTTTTFTPPNNTSSLNCFLRVTVTDDCGTRTGFDIRLISVQGRPGPPVAVDDHEETQAGTPVTVNPLANDTDPNSDPLTLTSLLGATNTGNGVFVNNGNGAVTYTPNFNFTGTDQINYRVCDNTLPASGGPLCDTATIFITVNWSEAHGCYPNQFWGVSAQGNATAVTAQNGMTNPTQALGAPVLVPSSNSYYAKIDNDADYLVLDLGYDVSVGDTIWLHIGSDDASPATLLVRGTLTGTNYATGADFYDLSSFTTSKDLDNAVPLEDVVAYVPVTGAVRRLRFNRAVGAGKPSINGIRYVDSECVSAVPLANDDAVSMCEDNTTVIDVLANDDDPQDLPLSVNILTLPTNGVAVVLSDGTVRYKPNADYSGTDNFTYQACNSQSLCDPATVTITIVDDLCQAGQYATSSSAQYLYGFQGGNTTVFSRYNIAAGTWTALANAPAAVSTGGAVTFKSNYVFGFRGNASSQFWRYDIATNSWTAMANAPGNAGTGASLTCLGNFIYAIPGGVASTFWRYDIGSNTWSSLTAAPNTFGAGASLSTDGTYIYALRGNGSNNFYRYDIVTNTWSTLDNAPGSANTGASLTFNGTYFYGTRGNNTNDFWRYDRGTNAWTNMTNLPGTVGDRGALTFDGTYLYATGAGGTTNFWRYNIATDSWSTLTGSTFNSGGCLIAVGPAFGSCGGGCVTSPNTPPDAINDFATTPVNTPVTVTVQSNDSDPSGLGLTTYLGYSNPPDNGSVALSGNSIRYTPATSFIGLDTFNYKICNLYGCDSTLVIVNVLCADPEGGRAIQGMVFNDINRSATFNNGEAGVSNARVRLYTDINSNGSIDAGDAKLDSTLTDDLGNYIFRMANGGIVSSSSQTYYAINGTGSLSSGNLSSVTGAPDNVFVKLAKNNYVVLEFANTIPVGTTVSIYLASDVNGGSAEVISSLDGLTFNNPSTWIASYTSNPGNPPPASAVQVFSYQVAASAGVKYLKVVRKSSNIYVDAGSYQPTNGTGSSTSFSISRTISASSDDAEEEGPEGVNLGPGGMYLASTDLELTMDMEPAASGTQKIGLRFNSLSIPSGATITSATLSFKAIAADSPNTNTGVTSLTINGHAADNATTFTTAVNNITTRTLTTASVAWNPASWSNGTTYTSPELKTIVQEIVNRPGWTNGNSMVFVITGTGSRSTNSYDGSPTGAPVLNITYTINGAVTTSMPAMKDNQITVNSPTYNYGASQTVDSYNSGGIVRRALFKFDLSSIPSNATITSASMDLYTYFIATANTPVKAHRLTADWDQGSANAASGVSNWNQRLASPATNWTTAGGDYDPTAAASITTNGNTAGTYSFNLTNLVQSWVNGTFANHGVILLNDPGFLGVSWRPKEWGTTSQQPKLVVTYTVGAASNSYILQLSTASLPPNYTLTTDNVETAVVVNPGDVDCENNFGVINHLPPVANPDTAYVDAGTTPIINVISNDTDPEGTPLTMTILTNPPNGTAVNLNNGSLTFSPNVGFTGWQTFTYRVCDWGTPSLCDTTWVAVLVTPLVNNPPVAQDDYDTTSVNIPVETDVAANDFDPEFDMVSVSLSPGILQPANGTVQVISANEIEYRPNPGFTGNDSYRYIVCDNRSPARCDTARVYIHVQNNPPDARPDASGTSANVALPVQVLSNDIEPDGHAIILLSTGTNAIPNNGLTVQGGTVSVSNNGTPSNYADDFVFYTPPVGFYGLDTFYYRVQDSGTPAGYDITYVVIRVTGLIDLELTKTVNPSITTIGQNVTFTLTLLNKGPTQATGVLVADRLTGSYQYVSDNSAGAYDPVSGVWYVPLIGINQTKTLTITATILSSTNLKNVTEVIAAGQRDIDSWPNNDDGDQSEDDEDSATPLLNEICTDGIDNDGDGLVDCNDPDCSAGLAANAGPDATICVGGSTTWTASGSGGTSPYTYNWSNSLGSGASKTVSPAGTTAYTVTLTDANGCTSTDQVVVTVVAAPAISTQPTGFTECAGGSLSLSVSVTGGTPSLTYQWQSSPDNVSFSNIGGATLANYTPSSAAAGTTWYRVSVGAAGNGCGTVTSNSVAVIIVADPAISVQPVGSSVCTGGSATLSVTATGGTPSLTYQWQNSIDNSTFNNIAGATSSSYTTPGLAATTYYRVIISASGNGCGNVTSNSATVTVSAGPGITTQPTGSTICNGGTATLSITANGSPDYQWQNSNDNVTFTDITGATSSTYNTPVLAATTYYRVVVSRNGNGCVAVTSGAATVTVVADPAISVQPVGFTECIGGTQAVSVTATGGTPSLTYQWQSSPDNVTFSNIGGATLASYTPPSAAAGTTWYRVNVGAAGNGCGTVTSNSVAVIIVADPAISVQPTGFSECVGGTQSLSVTATGGTPSLTYQWQSSPDNITFSNIAGATLPNYTPSSAVAGMTWYRVNVGAAGNGCGTATSNSISVVVNSLPVVNAGIDVDICPGVTTTLLASATDGGGSYNYTWSHGLGAGANQTVSPGSNTTYTVMVTDANGCTATDQVAVAIYDAPVANAGIDLAICTGWPATLSATAAGGTGPYTYSWSNGLGSGSTKTVSPISTTSYTVTVTDAHGCSSMDLVTVAVSSCLEDCDNGLDDDGDGLIDCADPDCIAVAAPVLGNDTFNLCPAIPFTQLVIFNDGNFQNPVFSIASPPTKGTATINNQGKFSYTPSSPFCSTDQFTYQVCNLATGCCSQAIVHLIVGDNNAPLLLNVPPDITISCDDIVPDPPLVQGFDACPGIFISLQEVSTRIPGSTCDNYTITRTWTATDLCGNSSSASQAINVQDITPPEIFKVYTLANGKKAVAGVSQTASHIWKYVEFPIKFSQVPLVFSQVVSSSEAGAVTVQQRNVSLEGFDLCLREEEAANNLHLGEQVSWLAIEPGVVNNAGKLEAGLLADVTHQLKTLGFAQSFTSMPTLMTATQTTAEGDPFSIQASGMTPAAVQIRLREETSADLETSHSPESVAYLALEPGSLLYDEQGKRFGESGAMAVGNNWETVFLNYSYNKPIVLPGNFLTTLDPATIRVRNVTSNSFEIKIQEWDYLDGTCPSVMLSYLVVEGSMPTAIDSYCSGNAVSIQPGVNLFAKDNCDSQVFFDYDESSSISPTGVQVSRSWTATDDCGNTVLVSRTDTCSIAAVKLKVLLNGALIGNTNTALMRDDLRKTGIIPLQEPYSKLSGYQHKGNGGEETIHAAQLAVEGQNAIVDWVFVEVRDPGDNSEILATRSALLQRDGDVVSPSGDSVLVFPTLSEGDYYVTLRHRNHLGVMTNTVEYLSTQDPPMVDFMKPSIPVNGTDQAARLIGDKRSLWSGDMNGDRKTIYQGPGNDVFTLFTHVLGLPANVNYLANYISVGYYREDLNMDGKVIYQGPNNDRATLLYHVVLAHPGNPGLLANFIVKELLP